MFKRPVGETNPSEFPGPARMVCVSMPDLNDCPPSPDLNRNRVTRIFYMLVIKQHFGHCRNILT